MTRSIIQNSFVAGEISPSLFGRTDLAKFRNGASTMRNFFANYRGGASSRAGLKYVGTCLQDGTGPPPRDIKFQYNISQGYALEFGDNVVVRSVTGAANNGSGLIRLTLVSSRGLMTGDTMVVTGVVGTTEANGTWVITVVDGTHVDLQDSTFTNAYVSGGTTTTSSGYMRIKSNGAYVVESDKTITGATNANPAVITIPSHGYVVGDWIYISGVVGMTQLNGLSWVVNTVPSANTVTLKDMFGNVVNSISYGTYVSGGVAERIYTIASPYAAVDLPFLKYAQSADTMSFACINQNTNQEYPPYDLTRLGPTNWVFELLDFGSSIDAPVNLVVTAHSSTTLSTYYSYVVTAVDAVTGEESVASTPTQVQNNDISVNAGSNSMTWDAVTGAGSYNIYRATPLYGAMVPGGVLYYFVGSALSTNFVDTNIISDSSKVPPVHFNPFDGPGNYPSTVAYYQQRRVYGNTLNNPDTYFMSRPGAFTNFDSSNPTTDDDSITGAPWAQQINGIQFMVPMNPGLVILTGNGAWLLNGGNNAAITPSDQTATSQAYNGCHYHIEPIVINYDALYVQTKGSIVRDLSFNFFQNVFTGTDLTILSNHLFNYHQLEQWAYAEEPYKLLWAVRDDGIMLSLTYLKEQDVYAWARHDTNGFFVGVCTITEPPVDATYVITQRYINSQWKYYAERMDNRNWQNPEDCFCVDAGLAYPMTFPDATLTPAAADGTSNISSVNLVYGGSGYVAPTVEAIDETGAGTGATFSVSVSGGVITAINVLTEGQDYTPGVTHLRISDTVGSGAVAYPNITNIINFTASTGIFSAGNVGDIIRIGNNNAGVTTVGVTTNGGGKAVITEYVSSTVVKADVTQPITAVIPNNPNAQPVPAVSGDWSLTTPTTVVSGLNHLEGEEVSILADGSVEAIQTVVNGSITLPQEASAIVVGLPFVCQLQTLYLDPPEEGGTTQGKRKNIYNVTVRCETTRGISVGSNQPDSSVQPNFATVPWTGLKPIKQRNALIHAGSSVPLFTGDEYINITADWNTKAQVAIEQKYPLSANILAVVPNFIVGDTSG